MAKAYKIFFLLVFVLTVPSGLYAAELHFSPALATYSVGKTFTVNLLVSSGEQALNAVGGEVFFSPEVLSVVSVSKEQSVVNLWVSEPSFSNTAGSISFLYGPPSHVSQWMLGVASGFLTCTEGNITVGGGLIILYHGSSI